MEEIFTVAGYRKVSSQHCNYQLSHLELKANELFQKPDKNMQYWNSSSNTTNFSVADNMFSCINCGRNYRHKSDLNRHLRLECGKEPKFACVYCSKKFHQKTNLKRHLHTVHSNISTLFSDQI